MAVMEIPIPTVLVYHAVRGNFNHPQEEVSEQVPIYNSTAHNRIYYGG